MKFGFKHIILAAALMSAGSLTAQEQNDKTSFQKYNWFVTGAVNGEWLSNTTGNMIVGGKVGARYPTDPLLGIPHQRVCRKEPCKDHARPAIRSRIGLYADLSGK